MNVRANMIQYLHMENQNINQPETPVREQPQPEQQIPAQPEQPVVTLQQPQTRWIFLVLVLVIGLAAYTGVAYWQNIWPLEKDVTTEVSPSPTPIFGDGLSRYHSDVYGFSFDYPAGWQIQEYELPASEFVVVTIDPVRIPTEDEVAQTGLIGGRLSFALWPMTVESYLAFADDSPFISRDDIEDVLIGVDDLNGIKSIARYGGDSKLLELEDYMVDLPKPLSVGGGQNLYMLRIYYHRQLRTDEVPGTYDAVISDILDSLRIGDAPQAGDILTPKDVHIESGSLQTYTNEKYGFSIQVPSNWIIEVVYDKEDFLDVGIFLRESDESGSPYIFIAIDDYGAESSIEDDRYEYQGMILEDNQVTVAGITAYQLVTDSGFGIIGRKIYMDYQGRTYIIVTNGRDWADEFIETFTFIP
jgi:hypothetical protein